MLESWEKRENVQKAHLVRQIRSPRSRKIVAKLYCHSFIERLVYKSLLQILEIFVPCCATSIWKWGTVLVEKYNFKRPYLQDHIETKKSLVNFCCPEYGDSSCQIWLQSPISQWLTVFERAQHAKRRKRHLKSRPTIRFVYIRPSLTFCFSTCPWNFFKQFSLKEQASILLPCHVKISKKHDFGGKGATYLP